jgi:nitroreductase
MDLHSIHVASVDHVLTTTRAVRKRLDLTRSVEPEVIERCLEIAMQAPTALYGETWHFVVVTDRRQREAVAAIYRKSGEGHRSGAMPLDPYLSQLLTPTPDGIRSDAQQRMFSSGAHLVQHMHEVPVLILACVEGRVENEGAGAQASLYGSIFPAVWSLMLAFRARGIGSVMTTQHIQHLDGDMAEVLGLPGGLTQAALLAAGYFTGADFRPAKRAPARDHTHWNRWGDHRSPEG